MRRLWHTLAALDGEYGFTDREARALIAGIMSSHLKQEGS